MKEVATGGSSNRRNKVKRFAERVAPVAQTTHPTRAGLARVLNSLCGATLSATREFAGLVQVLNSLVVVAMITTRELLAPWGLSIYFMGQFFACLFCGNQSIACTQFQAGFFAKTANAVLAEKGKSERVKVKQKLIPRNQQRVKGTTESSRHGSRC